MCKWTLTQSCAYTSWVGTDAANGGSSAQDVAQSGESLGALYETLQVLVLEKMIVRLRSEDCTAQELQAAVSMLRAGGVQARGAGQGVESVEERSLKDWLEGMTEEQKAQVLAERLRKGGSTGKDAKELRSSQVARRKAQVAARGALVETARSAMGCGA